MEKMEAKRRNKVKGGSTDKAIAATTKGVHKLLTQYEGVAEANP